MYQTLTADSQRQKTKKICQKKCAFFIHLAQTKKDEPKPVLFQRNRKNAIQLFVNCCNDTRTYGSTTLTDSETQTFFDSDRLNQLNVHFNVIARCAGRVMIPVTSVVLK